MEIQLHSTCQVIIRCFLPLKVTWGKTLSSQTDTALFDPSRTPELEKGSLKNSSLTELGGWLVGFFGFLGNCRVNLGCTSTCTMKKKKKIWTLEPKWPGSNPASSAECQCKLTKHSKLLFPHLWCRNWCLPCWMTGGTKWVNCKLWTSSGLSKHCSSFRSSVRQSESPPLHPFHWVERVTQRDDMYSESRSLGFAVGGQGSRPSPAPSRLCHLGQFPEPRSFLSLKAGILSVASP